MSLPASVQFFILAIAFLMVTVYGFMTSEMLVAIAGAAQGIGCAFMAIVSATE